MNHNLFLRAIEFKKFHDPTLFPFSLPVINKLEKLIFNKPITFFLGENGAGKSTLLEAIAIALGFNPEGGSKNFRFSTHNSHSELSDYIRTIKGVSSPKDGYFLRSESFYNLLTEIDALSVEDYYGGESLHSKSHGEGILSLLSSRLYGNGIYIFDEPECALSPLGLFKLLTLIHELVKSNSQFIIATHSPIILAYPDAEILEFKDSTISPISYKESDVYNLYKRFLDDDNFVKELLA